MILVSIVLTFLVCHTFRLVIQAYEVTHPSHSTEEHHGFCHAQGRSVSKKVLSSLFIFNTEIMGQSRVFSAIRPQEILLPGCVN